MALYSMTVHHADISSASVTLQREFEYTVYASYRKHIARQLTGNGKTESRYDKYKRASLVAAKA